MLLYYGSVLMVIAYSVCQIEVENDIFKSKSSQVKFNAFTQNSGPF